MEQQLRSRIRDIPDFPKPGILFKDITPLLQDAETFQLAIDEMCRLLQNIKVDRIVAIESRGFIFGSAIALKLGVGMIPVRKPGKLPFQTSRVEYALEYGTDALEMHVDALGKGDHVVIVDDILATGGTAQAAARLVESAGANVVALAFLSELPFLNGRQRLGQYNIVTLLSL